LAVSVLPAAVLVAQATKHRDYERAIRSGRFQSLRRRLKRLAGHRCEGYDLASPDGRCRATDDLTVHHLSYDHLGREYPWELEVLCQACHDRVHRAEREARRAREVA
jgi:5-methylcytosine-specific restriction endonuclease McrA